MVQAMYSKIVLANGCFDPLHYGHVLHLRAAKKLGDYLVVAVTRDEFVNKGPGRPVFTIDQRCDMLRELRCVDHVFDIEDHFSALQLVTPDVFVKGAEYRGKISSATTDYCKACGIEIAFTDELTFSSTKLLNHYVRL